MKVTDTCPICGGEIVQDFKPIKFRYVKQYDGSHCSGCGIKFVFNVSKLENNTTREEKDGNTK